MRVARWGNNLAVRLPAAIVEALGLKEGDNIEITIRPRSGSPAPSGADRDALLKRLRAFRGRLPADFKFDRDDANSH